MSCPDVDDMQSSVNIANIPNNLYIFIFSCCLKLIFFYITTYIHKMFINYSVFDKKMQYWMIYDFF